MTLFRLVRFNQFWLMLIAPLVAVVLVGALESRSMADELPRLLLLHAKGLNQIKERLQDSDPALVPAFV
ncbi:MAG: hypothetical protein ACTHMB_07220, partial [Candidatus Binatia bacterium]